MGKKTKVVIDTNIIVSAFGWGGKPNNIVAMAASGELLNCTSMDMLDELRRVLSYPKMGFSDELQAEIIETVFGVSTVVDVTMQINVIKEDPDDNMLIECALSAGANYIITGDRHLLALTNYQDIEIVSPEEFLKKRKR